MLMLCKILVADVTLTGLLIAGVVPLLRSMKIRKV